MAIYYRAQADTVERFLFTTEGYLLSDYLSRYNSKCVNHCVPSLRTSRRVALDVTHFQLSADLEVCRDYSL
jgi:hypothetical protein